MKQLSFHYGAISDSFERQARWQGYTLGKKASLIQELGDGLMLNHAMGMLSDKQYAVGMHRLYDYIQRYAKPYRKQKKKKRE